MNNDNYCDGCKTQVNTCNICNKNFRHNNKIFCYKYEKEHICLGCYNNLQDF